MSGPRIGAETRAAIADAMRDRVAGRPTVREIADSFGVSVRSVQTIAHDAGVVPDAARAQTNNATEQVRATNAQRRAALAARFLDAAERALDDMESPAKIYNFGGKDNTYNEVAVERPPTADQRNLMIIAATATDKHKVLDQYDSATDNADVSKFLEWLGGAPVKRGR